MIGKKMQEALNKQINAELYSAYLYLSMEAFFQSLNLPGFANWMRIQTQEELVHGLKIYDYVNKRGGRVTLKAIADPPVKWNSPLAAFEAVYKHEQKVTGLINDLVNLAIEQKDHAAQIFLEWFVSEQVEEEKSADEIVQKLKLMADAPGAIYMLDNEMARRVFNAPTTQGE
ncbi:MAG TPA: ferritin [Sedimentisphaerales bacterium]|nr:ferritin [Sedimentisphaerales bacterium]